MVYFLTSSPDIPITNELNPANGFIDHLNKYLSNRKLKALYFCSDPYDIEITEMYGYQLKNSFEEAGFIFEYFQIMDSRNRNKTEQFLMEADLIILAGGHVPTQNQYFHDIHLKELLQNYKGVIIGISAGSMNASKIVYAPPERDREATDQNYRRFLLGLGITKTMIIPHYTQDGENLIDGLKEYEEIIYPDSKGHQFYALRDGSYLYGHDGIEELYGEAYLISDCNIEKICENNQRVVLEK